MIRIYPRSILDAASLVGRCVALVVRTRVRP
jgi:hypothetical protein